jgi:hypothetical protein
MKTWFLKVLLFQIHNLYRYNTRAAIAALPEGFLRDAAMVEDLALFPLVGTYGGRWECGGGWESWGGEGALDWTNPLQDNTLFSCCNPSVPFETPYWYADITPEGSSLCKKGEHIWWLLSFLNQKSKASTKSKKTKPLTQLRRKLTPFSTRDVPTLRLEPHEPDVDAQDRGPL